MPASNYIVPMNNYTGIYGNSILPVKTGESLRTPLFCDAVKAGFPSPADDYIEQALDFNELLVKHPAATFCLRVSGNSMTGAGIHHNDILVVDRALTAENNSIVIASICGELTVKRMIKHREKIILAPENPDFNPVTVTEDMDFQVWGVVTNVIHKV
jgi:DNA polymerase V